LSDELYKLYSIEGLEIIGGFNNHASFSRYCIDSGIATTEFVIMFYKLPDYCKAKNFEFVIEIVDDEMNEKEMKEYLNRIKNEQMMTFRSCLSIYEPSDNENEVELYCHFMIFEKNNEYR
jgi:hypothetical protein